MTEKDLRHLRRDELLELLFEIRKEYDKLKEENDNLKQKLKTEEGNKEKLEQILHTTEMTEEKISKFLSEIKKQ